MDLDARIAGTNQIRSLLTSEIKFFFFKRELLKNFVPAIHTLNMQFVTIADFTNYINVSYTTLRGKYK
jgi:hypothetical protein